MARDPLLIGPFGGGLNLFDDPTAIRDAECVEALNWDPGLDGSLKARPAFKDLMSSMPLGATGNPHFIGVYYAENGQFYILAADGISSTYSYFNGVWTLVTATFSAAAGAQFDGKAWLVSPIAEADPGGYWTPAGGFVADANMPHGDAIIAYKFRLWVARGKNATQGTRVYYSKLLGMADFWLAPGFVDVGAGDGQSIVTLAIYYNSLIVFRTRSIWTIQYASDPALGTVQVLIPGVGLENKFCQVADENFIFFMYEEKAYQFINNQVQQINVKVPFEALSKSGVPQPYAVSVVNKRVIFSYYDTMFIYSLYTKTWTRWRTPTFGPLGRFVSPVSPATVNSSYVLPSGLIPAGGIIRRNRSLNPSFEVNVNNWGVSAGASSFVRTTAVPGTPHAASWVASAASSQVMHFDLPVVPLEHLSFRTRVRSNLAGAFNGRLVISWTDAGTLPVGTSTTVQAPGVTNDGWTVIEALDVEVPAGAAMAKMTIGFTNAVSGQTYYVDNTLMEDAATYDGTYFDGSTTDTVNFDYAWVGTAGNSPSTITEQRVVPLLVIEEETFANEEIFDCVLRTKNFNFELPGNFKRLFWWGVEAIFQGVIRGEAIPVIQTQVETWGQLLAQGKTWGDLRKNSWGSLLKKSSIETVYDGESSGPNRKFVKFRKGLRFRQVGFEVTFTTDATTPLYLFSISAYVASKETAVRAIS